MELSNADRRTVLQAAAATRPDSGEDRAHARLQVGDWFKALRHSRPDLAALLPAVYARLLGAALRDGAVPAGDHPHARHEKLLELAADRDDPALRHAAGTLLADSALEVARQNIQAPRHVSQVDDLDRDEQAQVLVDLLLSADIVGYDPTWPNASWPGFATWRVRKRLGALSHSQPRHTALTDRVAMHVSAVVERAEAREPGRDRPSGAALTAAAEAYLNDKLAEYRDAGHADTMRKASKERVVKACRDILELYPLWVEARGTLRLTVVDEDGDERERQAGERPDGRPATLPASPVEAAVEHRSSGLSDRLQALLADQADAKLAATLQHGADVIGMLSDVDAAGGKVVSDGRRSVTVGRAGRKLQRQLDTPHGQYAWFAPGLEAQLSGDWPHPAAA